MNPEGTGKVRTVCCDTSFLRALYGVDVHTPTANSIISRLQEPVVVTRLNVFEFGNSVRFAECRQWLPTGQATVLIASLRHDLQLCRIVEAIHFNPASVLIQADLLSSRHSLRGTSQL